MAKVFDFDGTLYDGDSTIDFWLFAIRRQPKTILALPRQLWAGTAFALKRITRDEFKEAFFSFLPYITHIEHLVENFWRINLRKIKPPIASRLTKGDYIVSASPQFLLAIPAARLGAHLIATKVDPATGKLRGRNCRGSEKVLRCTTEGAPIPFSECYTDSMSDLPLTEISASSFLVKGNRVSNLPETV